MFPNTFLVGFFLLYFGIFSGSNGRFNDKSEIFSFPEYAYKQTNKNELTYREFEVACENSKSCLDLEGVDKVKCQGNVFHKSVTRTFMLSMSLKKEKSMLD
uniref:Uncharacterized protein n=1 Tax=Megaselia scalaris TaxID=36166 RepID=T1GRU8_MEGSC